MGHLRRARRVGHLVAAAVAGLVTVELSVAEFVALRRLPDSELRERFNLPPSCQPALSAVRGVRTTVIVVVRCLEDDGDGGEEDRPAGR